MSEYLERFLIPSDPMFYPIRPMDKGMILNVAPQVAPPQSFQDLKGMIVRNGLLERVPCFTYYRDPQGDIPDDLPLRGLHVTWNDLGERDMVLFGSRNVYTLDRATGVTRIRWQFVPTSTGTVAITGGSYRLTISQNLSTANLVPGDSLWIEDGSQTKKFDILDIQYQTSSTVFLFEHPGYRGDTIGEGVYPFTVERNVRSWGRYCVDWVVYEGYTIIADNSNRGLLKYTTATNELSLLNPTQDPDIRMITCVDVFNDRVYIGGFIEEGIDHRNRIRWTNPTDYTTFPAENYVDLVGVSGEIYRLKGLGAVQVAYFTDGVFVGRTTNYANLPTLYTLFDTGGIGLIGPRALCSALDGHFFVGQDDIYYLSGSLGLQRIGSPVVNRTIKRCQAPHRVYVVPDPVYDRIVFGFPETGEQIVKLWYFTPATGAWSYEELGCGMLAYTGEPTDVLVRELTQPVGFYTHPVASWMGGETVRDLFVSVDGFVLRTNPALSESVLVGAPSVRIESQDLDFGEPDTIKTVTRLSFKLNRLMEADETLIFHVAYSINRGMEWRTVGQVVIGPGDDEARVNFLATGSLFRFRLESASPVRPYGISEFVLRVRKRGVEVST